MRRPRGLADGRADLNFRDRLSNVSLRCDSVFRSAASEEAARLRKIVATRRIDSRSAFQRLFHPQIKRGCFFLHGLVESHLRWREANRDRLDWLSLDEFGLAIG